MKKKFFKMLMLVQLCFLAFLFLYPNLSMAEQPNSDIAFCFGSCSGGCSMTAEGSVDCFSHGCDCNCTNVDPEYGRYTQLGFCP